MIKAIYLDFDGTIFSHKTKCIPESAIKALNLASGKGIKIILATGRSKKEMEVFDVSRIPFDAFMLFNGLAIYDKDYKPILINKFEGFFKEEMIRLFNKKEYVIWFSTEDDCYLNMDTDYFNETPFKPEIKEYQGEDIIMGSAIFNTKEQLEEMKRLNDYCDLTRWTDNAYDIVNKGWSKASGIEYLNDYYGYTFDEVITIGDSDNDMEMLRDCPNSIAMGNGTIVAKNVSSYVTSDIDQDGIYQGLKHLGVI